MIIMRLIDIQSKKIIDVTSGKNIGSIVDINITNDGSIDYFIIDSGRKIFSLNKEDDFKIYWRQIEKIGEDVILINPSK